jgi:hypothetical protein
MRSSRYRLTFLYSIGMDLAQPVDFHPKRIPLEEITESSSLLRKSISPLSSPDCDVSIPYRFLGDESIPRRPLESWISNIDFWSFRCGRDIDQTFHEPIWLTSMAIFPDHSFLTRICLYTKAAAFRIGVLRTHLGSISGKKLKSIPAIQPLPQSTFLKGIKRLTESVETNPGAKIFLLKKSRHFGPQHAMRRFNP